MPEIIPAPAVQVIQQGDVVYLKSGSPPMTVYTIGLDGDMSKIGVTYYLPGGQCQTAAFPTATLTKTPEPIAGGLQVGLNALCVNEG